MPSANNLYQTIMSSLQEMNLQPELKDFLKQQSLSLMRGIPFQTMKRLNRC